MAITTGLRKLLCASAGAMLLTGPVAIAAQGDGADFFETNVRPVLAERCFACHSASSNPVMGGLRMDSREGLLKGGGRGAALVPGEPEQSLLLRAVLHTAGNLKMPPGPKLSEAQTAALAHWVKMGAPWGAPAVKAPASETFWAFVPPQQPAPPAVKTSGWVKTPIDAFVLAALEKKGLAPARSADKRTLIRRATFDLIGLPPTPDEVRAFVNDSSPDAFASVVDRLLASPRYGERWGRHWLDVARYADSNGLDENLVYKNAFRYRDYVIAAFNKDKPYDQFVHEQLAGDLLSGPAGLETTFERWTATGFLSLGAKMLAEDDPVKMEMDIIDEQLDTAGRTFMGLTIGCARCHDHKFDPIPQADYYSMAGIFKSSKTMENFKVVAKWHEYVLAPAEDRERLAAHEASIEAKRKEAERVVKAENAKLAADARDRVGAYLMAAYDVEQANRIHLEPAGPRAAIVRDADSFEAGNVNQPLEKKKANVPKDAKGPYFAEYRISTDKAGEFQIDLLDDEKGAGTADIVVNGVLVKRGAPPVQNREASPDVGGWSATGIFALTAGENIIRLEHKSRFPYFGKLAIAPSPFPPGAPAPKTTAQIARQHGVNPSFLEQFVAHLARSNGAPASVLYAWEILGTQKSIADWASPAAQLFADFRSSDRAALAARYQELFREALRQGDAPADPGMKALRELLFEKFGPFRAPGDARDYYAPESRQELAKLEREASDLEKATPEFPRAMGVRESGVIADLPIHIRGSHWTLGDKVPRRFLSAIDGGKQQSLSQEASGRLELARWLTAKNHPLTSRVMANRIWRWHFGKGIVPSADNFGRLGEAPTNQPLLDWLAVRFVESGWSIKAMHRLIMLSNTYQMSSEHDQRSAEADPENTLLWRVSRRRLEAEEIRDAIMAVSGDLEFISGGSIMKYKDREYVANTSRRGDVDYDRNIRAVYIPVVRSSMYDVFRAFDLPDPSTPNGDRDSTVVAPQALFMMNGSVVLKHSRLMAENLLRAHGEDAERIRQAYERALARYPSAKETDQALTFIARVEKVLGDRTLAWQSFCKALMASNEFIYLN